MFSTILAYVCTVALFLIIPGPVGLLVIRAAAVRGWRGVLAAIFGSNSASLVLIGVAGLMLAGVAGLSPRLFNGLSVLGGLYLLYYAFVLWQERNAKQEQMDTPPLKLAHLSRQAFFVGLSNPKDVIFFLTFFPPFIERLGVGLGQGLLVLTLLWCVLDYSILLAYGVGAAAIVRGKYQRVITIACALLFALIGIYACVHNVQALLATSA